MSREQHVSLSLSLSLRQHAHEDDHERKGAVAWVVANYCIDGEPDAGNKIGY